MPQRDHVRSVGCVWARVRAAGSVAFCPRSIERGVGRRQAEARAAGAQKLLRSCVDPYVFRREA
eukprot:11215696-Lingulodinium_polyedra.AAC.1